MAVIERTTRAFSHGGLSRYVALSTHYHVFMHEIDPPLNYRFSNLYITLDCCRCASLRSPPNSPRVYCKYDARDDQLRRDIKVIYSLVINMDIELMLYLTEKRKQEEKLQLGIITQRAIMNYNIT